MTNEQINELNNEALLDEIVEAYITKQDYQDRVDYIKWTQELENEVVNEYWNLYHEALRRMEEN